MTATVAVLDYGSGNLRSAERALARTGADVSVTKDYAEALEADGLVVPGVGAYAACMRGLHLVRGGTLVWDRLRKQRPVLGICVGMQVLFEEGVEHGVRFAAAVERGVLSATQFHPEKSGDAGAALLQNWVGTL